MVQFLVEERGLDVDARDYPGGQQWPARWGSPMAYAARYPGGGEVVRYLLDVSWFFSGFGGLLGCEGGLWMIMEE